MSKVWMTKADLVTKYMGFPSLSNGYDAQREMFLNSAIQDSRTSDEKRAEYRDETLQLMDLIHSEEKLYRNFKPINSEPLKVVLWPKKPITEDFIYMSGRYVFVREDFAEILMQFNVGQTKLFNVGCPLARNGQVIYDREFYLLNVTEWRNYFIPEKSELLYPLSIQNDGYNLYSLGDGSFRKSKVTLSKQSLACDVDIWHDPMILNSIFFSDRLKNALDEKGLLAQTKHKKCLVLI